MRKVVIISDISYTVLDYYKVPLFLISVVSETREYGAKVMLAFVVDTLRCVFDGAGVRVHFRVSYDEYYIIVFVTCVMTVYRGNIFLVRIVKHSTGLLIVDRAATLTESAAPIQPRACSADGGSVWLRVFTVFYPMVATL